MGPTVYIDLYFFINTGMDLLCLLITATVLRRRVKRWRLLVAALFGGLYACLSLLYLPTEGLFPLAVDLAVAVLLSLIAVCERRMRSRRLLSFCALFLSVSALLGGIMTALYSLLNRLDLPFEFLEGDGLSVWAFTALALLSSLLTLRGGRLFRAGNGEKTVMLTLVIFGKELSLTALADSGNLLREPMTGRGVIPIEEARLLPLFPPALRHIYERRDSAAWLSYPDKSLHPRLIPIKTASGEGVLFSLCPERLMLGEGADARPGNFLIAPAPLGKEGRACDALIPDD